MITPAASVKRAASTASATLLAVDLGATWTRACALADDGTVLRRHAARTPRDGSPAQLTEALVAVAATVHDALEPARAQTLRAIGVAATGPLDAATGVLLGPPNMGDGYRDLPLAAPLRERFGLPVAVERDTNAAALGEHAFGAAGGADEFLYLTVSSGIGGAVFARGRLLTGAGGAAGELGHTPVALGEPPCSCGTPGHLEAISSGDGIARAGRAAAAAGRWTPPDRDDGAPPAPDAIGALDVVAGERAGDAVAHAIMERARDAFAVATVGFVNSFDPGLVVVGGAVARGEGERLLGRARDAVAAHAFTPSARTTRIVAAELGDDSGLIGCLPLAAGATWAVA